MEIPVETKARQTKSIIIYLILVLIGILLNIIPASISAAIGSPLWLDAIGTIFVAIVGGYIPGIFVGFVTNLLKGFTDITSVYYATLNVMISVCATFLAGRGWHKKIHTSILMALALALIGSGLGGLLPWFLAGFPTHGYLNDLGIDFIDKLISVAIVILLLRFVPESYKKAAYFRFWMQTPLSEDEEKSVKKIRCRTHPIRSKIVFILICSLILLAMAATIISFALYRTATIAEYSHIADNVGYLAAAALDPEKVDEYIEKGESAEGYLEIQSRLQDIRDAAPDVKYLYVYKIMEDGCHVVFDLDTEELQGNEPGDIVEFDPSFEADLPLLLDGKEIDPVISNDSFGWLLTSYVPVRDKDGNCVCYVGTDIAMKTLIHNQMTFVVQMVFLFAGFVILILSVAVWIGDYCLVYPINSMTLRTQNIRFDDTEAVKNNVDLIKSLNIYTGDEVENLFLTTLAMTERCAGYVEEIQLKNDTISKMQSSLIIVLADMVENRDENTGAHIRKTAEYVRIILTQMRELGMHKDIITDEYIENVVHSAPLHDIGKIQVPDAVLNKPGKLNDMEYEIMKTHTTAGKAVIDQVIAQVPNCAYLKDARDMAHYHHEKWNGTGYPEKLAGEEIPLSARVMAVADVFDALVSKRVYKPAMPYEKAFSIIKEESGKHFDPDVVKAFFAAEDEVVKVEAMFQIEPPVKEIQKGA